MLASLITWTEPTMYLKGDRWHGPPGAFMSGSTPEHWVLCCPRCGEVGSPRDGARWTVVAGSLTEEGVRELTLSPSIQKNCCGWHGYLRGGRFEEC